MEQKASDYEFWSSEKSRALVERHNFEHGGRAAVAVLAEAFDTDRSAENANFANLDKLPVVFTVSSEYDDETIRGFLRVVERGTDTEIVVNSYTNIHNRIEYSTTVRYKSDQSSGSFIDQLTEFIQ